jgi:hypothetical protein
MVAERTRPALAALVATLPLSVGATYVLLALEQDATFVSAAALKSVAGACSTTVFIVAYAYAVLRLRPVPALIVAYLAWLPVAWFVHIVDWTVATVLAFSVMLMAAAYVSTLRLRSLRSLRAAKRYWYDPLIRAGGVALLVSVLSGLSDRLGSSGVGTLANFPIIMSSVGVILHIRMGPEAAAGMLSNAVAGMVGVCLGLLQVHMTIVPLGAALSLALGLAICVVWNLMLFAIGRRQSAGAAALRR